MAYRPNFILQTDSYKQFHHGMRIKKTTRTASYFGTRIGALHPSSYLVGLQVYLKEYLEGPRITEADIDEAWEYNRHHFAQPNFNEAMWDRILRVYGGRLPLRILAWDEGSRVPVNFPLFTVVNTDPYCEALTNHIEPLLSKVWYPMTVATLSGHLIDSLGELVVKSGGPREAARYMLHDFGYRGVSSEESARIGGLAHLVHGQGTDTMQAMQAAVHYYGASLEGLAGSVAASEHSVMTAGGPQEEIDIAKYIITHHPNQIVSLVADSYNYYEFVDAMINCAQLVDRCGVKLVIRPDSVTPTHQDPKDLMLWSLYRVKGRLPFETTPTGHCLPKYSFLWGDGLEPAKILEIANAVVDEGFAAHSTVYGMGGGLLQKVNRDMERCAMKSSAQERDGVWVDVKKSPLDQSKASLTGRMQVVKITGQYQIVPEDQWPEGGCLKPVFENGVILRQHTFDQVRARARTNAA